MSIDDSTDHSQMRHQPTVRWQVGLALAVVTVVLWSTVPIALSLLLDKMDAITISWYRFLVAAVILVVLLRAKGTLPPLEKLRSRSILGLIVIAAVGLTANFVLYVYALNFIPPGAAPVIYQLAPLLVLLGGVVLFKESFRPVQWVGCLSLIAGLLLFFNRRINEFAFGLTDYWFGAMLLVLAAVLWAAYALAQKQLLRVYSPSGIMLLLYSLGVLMMLPLCSPMQIGELSAEQYFVLAYLCGNALIGYGCFAEALKHWEASRVSAVTATNPLLALGLAHAAGSIWPERIVRDELNRIVILGAVLVVGGAALTALGGRQRI